jgi:hypothetical protein
MAKPPPRKPPEKAKRHHLAVYLSDADRRAWSKLQAEIGIFENQRLLLMLIRQSFSKYGIDFKDD